MPKTLDVDSGKCDSLRCELIEKGFRDLFRGPFSLPCECGLATYHRLSSSLISITVEFLKFLVKLVQLCRNKLSKRWDDFLFESN